MSVPRSGTRFLLYFCLFVLEVEARHVHFFRSKEAEIREVLASDDIIVVPMRPYDVHAKSLEMDPRLRQRLDNEWIPIRDKYMPRLLKAGAHFIDIEKGKHTFRQFDALLLELGLNWTPEIREYVEQWRRVGSQHDANKVSDQVVRDAIVERIHRDKLKRLGVE